MDILNEKAIRVLVYLSREKEGIAPYWLMRKVRLSGTSVYHTLHKFEDADLVVWTRGARGKSKVAITEAGLSLVPQLVELAKLFGYEYGPDEPLKGCSS